MYYSPETKSSPAFVGVTEHPTFIVGQNIGHEPDGSHTGVVWEKNRSAELIWEAIESNENIFLTNACNYTEMTENYMREGYNDLRDAIESLEPKKIVCLGKIAREVIEVLLFDWKVIDLWFFSHPSYILRMNLNKERYINSIKEALL